MIQMLIARAGPFVMGSRATLLLLVLSVRRAHAWTSTLCSGGSTCYSADCDYWGQWYSCATMEYDYGCDCSGCSYCTPSAAPTGMRPTLSAAPTLSPTKWIRNELAHSFCFGECDLRDQVSAANVTLQNGAACADGEGLVLVDADSATMTAVETGGEMSLALWVKISTDCHAATGKCRFIMFKNDDNTAGFNVYYEGGMVKASSKPEGYWMRTAEGDALDAGAWAHVVATFSESTIDVYQDGRHTATEAALAAPARLTRDSNIIGKKADGVAIHQLQVWDRALDAAEVARLYNATRDAYADDGGGSACLTLPPPSLAPTASAAPTATVGATFYMSDAGGDGWEGATYTFTEYGTANVIASGTLDDGAAGSAYVDSFELLGCYELDVSGGDSDAEIGWRLGEDYHQCNSDLEYVSYDAPAGRG